MPVVIDINMPQQAVTLTATGTVHGDELVAANHAFFRDRLEDFRACRIWLGDYTQATLEQVEMGHLHILAQLSIDAARINPRLSVAIATNQDLSFGTARAWEGLADATGWNTMVFRSRELAQQWLDEQPR
jgi:hypothetical protein